MLRICCAEKIAQHAQHPLSEPESLCCRLNFNMDKNGLKDFVTLRSRERKGGRKALYLDICENGKRRTEYLKLYLSGGRSREDKAKDKETMRMAEDIRDRRAVEMQERRLGLAPAEREEVRFFDYFERLMDAKQGTTRTSWGNCLTHLQRYERNRDILLSEIDTEWVEGFREHLDGARSWQIDDRKRDLKKDAGLAESTKALMFQKLRSLFSQALRKGLIARNPAADVDGFSDENKPREYLTIEELTRLTSTPMPDKASCEMFLFSCLTGMRWSDIMRMRWSEVQRLGGRTRIVFTQQKTGNREWLDITEQAAELLGERGNDDDVVFDKIRTRHMVSANVKAWCAVAGIKKHISFHCGRHTFAVMMLTLGVDLYTVSKLMGHRSIETTQIYAKIVDRVKQDAVDRIPRFNL